MINKSQHMCSLGFHHILKRLLINKISPFMKPILQSSIKQVQQSQFHQHYIVAMVMWYQFNGWAFHPGLIELLFLSKICLYGNSKQTLPLEYKHKISHANLARNESCYQQQTQKSSETWQKSLHTIHGKLTLQNQSHFKITSFIDTVSECVISKALGSAVIIL